MKFLKRISTSISLFFSKIVIFFQKYFIDFFKNKDLTKRIILTLSLLAIFVALGSITLPGVNLKNQDNLSSTDFFGIMNTLGGGGLRRFSLVSLGISPFISASLIMTFAQTKLVPPIQRLSQSGPLGRMKINVITKWLSFIIGIIQAIVLTKTLESQVGTSFGIEIQAGFNNIWYIYFVIPAILVAGSFFSVFLSEEITNKGIGNGTSLLILSGILIALPEKFISSYRYMFSNTGEVSGIVQGVIYFIVYLIIFIGIMYLVNLVYQAERKIPIQHIGAGRSRNLKELSYLPLKINSAGVMPIIFAMLVTSVPLFIANLVDILDPGPGFGTVRWMQENLILNKPIGITIFGVSTFILTIIMCLQQSRLDKIVEDFNKNSTYIPGLRPGEQTEDYLTSIVLRLSIFSAFYMTLLGSSEYLLQMAGVPAAITYGGTSFMILVSVNIETIQQIQARIKTSQYIKHKKTKVVETYNFNDETRDVSLIDNSTYVDYNDAKNDDKGDGSILW
ncbi:MAG: preprotein translocase subunit SecY [Metamycoplasmataceae bacterium]